jgi:hypothetical protein
LRALSIPPARPGAATPGDAAERHAAEDRAMEALRRSVSAGFADVATIRTDPDLDPLKGRADFRALLDQLTKSKADGGGRSQ